MMNRNSVLKQRTLTGIIFGIVVLSMLSYNPWSAFILLAIIAFGASREYIFMLYPNDNKRWWICALLISGLFAVMLQFAGDQRIFLPISLLACVLFLAGIVHLFMPFIPHKRLWWIMCTIYTGLPLALAGGFIYTTLPYQPAVWISILVLIWVNDSFAYLVGSRIGRNKLWPAISPGKTWEGFIGGGVFTIAASLIIFSVTGLFSLVFWLICGITVWLIGTLGDLFESSVKRSFNVKDSGNLLPGHGGILDRFDSFIYVLPFILFLLLIFQNAQ